MSTEVMRALVWLEATKQQVEKALTYSQDENVARLLFLAKHQIDSLRTSLEAALDLSSGTGQQGAAS